MTLATGTKLGPYEILSPLRASDDTPHGLFLAGSLSDAKAVASWRFRHGVAVRDVPSYRLDLGELELWNPGFSMLVHRFDLV